MKNRQSSLPEMLTRNAGVGTGFATGFSVNRPQPVRPEQPENQPARITDTRQHHFNSRQTFIGTNVEAIIGANELRRFLMIQNNGTVNVFLGFGIPANLNGQNSFVLPPNGVISFETGVCPNNEIFAVASVQCALSIIEGIIK